MFSVDIEKSMYKISFAVLAHFQNFGPRGSLLGVCWPKIHFMRCCYDSPKRKRNQPIVQCLSIASCAVFDWLASHTAPWSDRGNGHGPWHVGNSSCAPFYCNGFLVNASYYSQASWPQVMASFMGFLCECFKSINSTFMHPFIRFYWWIMLQPFGLILLYYRNFNLGILYIGQL